MTSPPVHVEIYCILRNTGRNFISDFLFFIQFLAPSRRFSLDVAVDVQLPVKLLSLKSVSWNVTRIFIAFVLKIWCKSM